MYILLKEELQSKCWEELDTSYKLVVRVQKSLPWESWTQQLAKVTGEKTFLQHSHLIGTPSLRPSLISIRAGRRVAARRPPCK